MIGYANPGSNYAIETCPTIYNGFNHMHLRRTLSKTSSDLVVRFGDILDSSEQPTRQLVKLMLGTELSSDNVFLKYTHTVSLFFSF